MTQEEKELLLKDLCARLPYRVKVQVKDWTFLDTELKIGHINQLQTDDIELKPYLRPMSSMTEEEAMEYANCGNIIANSPQNNYLTPNPNCVDWLNAHHFDYRGLIEKGLAIAVTKKNNPYEN